MRVLAGLHRHEVELSVRLRLLHLLSKVVLKHFGSYDVRQVVQINRVLEIIRMHLIIHLLRHVLDSFGTGSFHVPGLCEFGLGQRRIVRVEHFDLIYLWVLAMHNVSLLCCSLIRV